MSLRNMFQICSSFPDFLYGVIWYVGFALLPSILSFIHKSSRTGQWIITWRYKLQHVWRPFTIKPCPNPCIVKLVVSIPYCCIKICFTSRHFSISSLSPKFLNSENVSIIDISESICCGSGGNVTAGQYMTAAGDGPRPDIETQGPLNHRLLSPLSLCLWE